MYLYVCTYNKTFKTYEAKNKNYRNKRRNKKSIIIIGEFGSTLVIIDGRNMQNKIGCIKLEHHHQPTKTN